MDSARIAIRLQPRAGRNKIVGVRDGAVVVRVAAAPVDGRANDALCRLIAKRAGVPRSQVAIVRGERARDKLVEVEGIDEKTLHEMLGLG